MEGYLSICFVYLVSYNYYFVVVVLNIAPLHNTIWFSGWLKTIMYILWWPNLDTVLKTTLKRQVPFLIGGTITGTIMAYYYGILFTIIVNSIIWFVISMIVNKYYWKYTGFKDEMYLLRKYIFNRKKNGNKNSGL